MLDGSMPMALNDSLVLAAIGVFIVFLELAILAVMIVLISKVIRALSNKGTEKPEQKPVTPAPAVSAPPPPAPVAVPVLATPSGLVLEDVDEPTAATLMALISHETGVPLNRLMFKSIKGVIEREGVSDDETAVLMAMTAHQMGKPVNKLIFKSIKKVG